MRNTVKRTSEIGYGRCYTLMSGGCVNLSFDWKELFVAIIVTSRRISVDESELILQSITSMDIPCDIHNIVGIDKTLSVCS